MMTSKSRKALLFLFLAAGISAYQQSIRPSQLKKQRWETVKQRRSTPFIKQAWEKVTELAAVDEVVEARIVNVNRGGAICCIHGLKAFLPNSHLMTQPVADKTLIGKTLPLKVVTADAEANKLVVSNRLAAKDHLSKGDVVHGVITGLRPFGVIVTFGGMRGLLHKSNISFNDWKLVRNEAGYKVDECFRSELETDKTFLKLGTNIKCMVIGHDKDSGRFSLSTAFLEKQPGDMLRDSEMVFAEAESVARRYLTEEDLLDYILEQRSLHCSLLE